MLNRKPRILVVDDERQMTRVLRTSLKCHGYEVRVAGDGTSALEIFGDWEADLVLTDLAMSKLDGLDLCRRLRAVSQVPIIVLSVRGEEGAKIEALDAGADDYVTKPFGINELLARLRAALRRPRMLAPAENVEPILKIGDFRVDLESRSVEIRGREIHLTPTEFKLLLYFLQHSGKVLTHRALLGAVWGSRYVEQGEYLRVFVGQLRKKLESDSPPSHYIITEPWVGYRFEPGP